MAYDEDLAERARAGLMGRKGFSERKMFGGIAFMLDGRMCCGVLKSDLMVRVSPEDHEKMLREPHARPMDFTGRPMKGFLFVDPGGHRTEMALGTWIDRSVAFVSTLPEKKVSKRMSVKLPRRLRRR